MCLQDASSIADLYRGGDPAVEAGARVDRAAMRVDAGGNIFKQRPSSSAEGFEGFKTNGAKVHTVGEGLVFAELLCLCLFSDRAGSARRSRNVAGRARVANMLYYKCFKNLFVWNLD